MKYPLKPDLRVSNHPHGVGHAHLQVRDARLRAPVQTEQVASFCDGNTEGGQFEGAVGVHAATALRFEKVSVSMWRRRHVG